MAAGDLCTLEEAKAFQSIDNDDSDATLELLITLASSWVQTEMGRVIAQATYTHYFSGRGDPDIPLRQRPVRSVTSVSVHATGYFGQASGAFPATSLLTAGDDYVLIRDHQTLADAGVPYSKSGILRWLPTSGFFRGDAFGGTIAGMLTPGILNPGWPRGVGNVKVVYVAGYLTADIPLDLKNATLLFVQTLKSQTDNNRFQGTSEALGPHSYQYGQLTYFAREVYGFAQIIRKYRELVL